MSLDTSWTIKIKTSIQREQEKIEKQAKKPKGYWITKLDMQKDLDYKWEKKIESFDGKWRRKNWSEGFFMLVWFVILWSQRNQWMLMTFVI